MVAVAEGNSDPQKLVEGFAHDACASLFEAYGVALQDVEPGMPPSDRLVLTAVIGFTGPGLRGTCILASTEQPLSRSNPVSGSLRDWIAELSNQLIGRVKN